MESITIRKRIRPHQIARAVPAVAEVVKRRATDRLMGTRGAILPSAERRSANSVGRATQARPGAGIEVGVPHAVARRARAVTEVSYRSLYCQWTASTH
jgi:hypothetical protein